MVARMRIVARAEREEARGDGRERELGRSGIGGLEPMPRVGEEWNEARNMDDDELRDQAR